MLMPLASVMIILKSLSHGHGAAAEARERPEAGNLLSMLPPLMVYR